MTPRIEDLAATVNASTRAVSEYLVSNSLPLPSFDEHGPVDLPIQLPAIAEARRDAINACHELLDLLQGPRALFRPDINGVSLQAIYRYAIPSKVPLGGEISFKDLSEQCGLPERDLRRIVRFGITFHRVFQEKRNGFISHSAASRWLAENAVARDGVGLLYDTFYRSFARTVDALQTFPNQEPNQTGFSLAHNTDQSLFTYLAYRPDEGRRFVNGMAAFTANVSGNSPSFLVSGYPWETLGQARIVDVGGSHGQIACELADAFPKLEFLVQDLPDVIQQASIPERFHDRVKLQAHDFFEKQETVADVYFFRWIFHDWPDKYVVDIIKQLVPAMQPGARVIVNDSISPGFNTVPVDVERTIRGVDMVMLSLHNSREREVQEWEPLFKAADARFGSVKFYFPEGSALGIMECLWEG